MRAGRQNACPRAQTRAQSNELLENQISKKRLRKKNKNNKKTVQKALDKSRR